MSTSATSGSMRKRRPVSSKAATESRQAEPVERRISSISVITTGGTFDKIYDVVKERFSFGQESMVPEIMRCAYFSDVAIKRVIAIDSLDMTTEHRAQISA